jgi:hypothetical protein
LPAAPPSNVKLNAQFRAWTAEIRREKLFQTSLLLDSLLICHFQAMNLSPVSTSKIQDPGAASANSYNPKEKKGRGRR